MNILIMFIIFSLGLLMVGSILLLVYYSLGSKGIVRKTQDNKNSYSFVSSAYDDENTVVIRNSRRRPEDVSIFDVLVSEKADFIKRPEGREILKAIRSFE